MRARFTKLVAGLAVLGVLAGGGASLATAASGPSSEPIVSELSSEAPSSEAVGSESASPSDGPGGYQDDPANPNADTQFQGEQ
jgi:hypothetical protein